MTIMSLILTLVDKRFIVVLKLINHGRACGQRLMVIKQNNQRGETSIDCFGRVREIGPPFSAEASCQVDAFPGQNDAFTFDLTNVER